MTVSRRNFLAGASAAPFVLKSLPSFAQEAWPAKEIHVVCGYAPGTGADILVRYFSEKLRKFTKQPMLVENKPGAGTTIASEYTVRSKPDGYTLFINPGNGLASFPYLYPKLGHNILSDLAPVTTLVTLPFCLAVPPNSPAKNVAEFIELIKKKGDKASYGYPNNISLACGELLNERAGLKAVGVAYKSTPEALNDMNNGLIDYLFSDATFGLQQAKGGKMRLLGFTSAKRSELDPNLPTLQESGVPNYNVSAWWGAWYPGKTPQAIVDQTAKWLNEIIADPETKEFLAKTAPADPFPGTPESLAAYLKEDVPRWTELFKLAKVQPN